MKDIRKLWAWKSRQIGWACDIMNAASSVMDWIDRHTPQWISDRLLRAYWFVDDLAGSWFASAYDGSWEEIRDAWNHAEEDWLSPFQKMVANERILPLSFE
jgi:hypothetical protein